MHQYDCEDGLINGVSAGKVIVDCATLAPEFMQAVEERVAGKGGQFLEAPVSGAVMLSQHIPPLSAAELPVFSCAL